MKSGRIKALAISMPKRFAGLPDVPALAEADHARFGKPIRDASTKGE